MIHRFKTYSSKMLVFVVASLLVFLFLANGLLSFGIQFFAQANGSLQQNVYQYDDFLLDGIRLDAQGILVSSDNDPKMIMEQPMQLSSICFYMETSIHPGEMVMYYTTKEGQGFSERKRVWAKPIPGKENWYEINMPLTKVLSIRIDPTMYAGNALTFGDFIFNKPKPFFKFFNIQYKTIFNFFIYTGIFSAILKFVQEILIKNSPNQ